MRHTVQIVQKRLKAPPLFWRIDMTAFAGVMLVLLWLFIGPHMLYTDFPRYRSVDLPAVSHPVLLRDADREDAIFIGIMKDGKVFFNTDQVRPGALPYLIRDALNHGSKPKIYFRVDARAKVRVFLEVFDEVRSTGIDYIAIIAEQRRPSQRGTQPRGGGIH